MERGTLDDSTESTKHRKFITRNKSPTESTRFVENVTQVRLPRLDSCIGGNRTDSRNLSENSGVSSTSRSPSLHNKKAVKKSEKKMNRQPMSNHQYEKTIVEVDPQFYTMVSNRPIKQKDDLRSYTNNIREVLISRITKGYLEEEILKTKRAFEHEEACYNEALKEFNAQEKGFQLFLAHDNDTAQTMLRQAREKEEELSLVTQEYEDFAYRLAKVKSQITFMNEGRLTLLSYEKFLHEVSPRKWKDVNMLKEYKKIPNTIGELSTYNIFNCDLRQLKSELASDSKPKLYFRTPNELISLFEMLQAQNLFYLLIAESTDSQKVALFNSKEKMRECFDQEVHNSQNVLRNLTELTDWLETQAVELQSDFLRILNKHFRDYVASELILKIHTHVEFAYKRTVSKDLMEMTALEMMQDLEGEYNRIINDLEVLDYDVVKSVEKKSFVDDLLLMKRASKADKQLKNYKKVQNRLKKSYSLPVDSKPTTEYRKGSALIKEPSLKRISSSAQNRLC